MTNQELDEIIDMLKDESRSVGSSSYSMSPAESGAILALDRVVRVFEQLRDLRSHREADNG